MVHRIQNRNPGYSDFTNTSSTQGFTFSNQNSSIITNGANALKIEEEVNVETENKVTTEINNTEGSDVSKNIEEENNIVDTDLSEVSEHSNEAGETNPSPSNGLENFNFDEETPELFNSDKPLDSEEFKSFDNSENSDDDEESESDDDNSNLMDETFKKIILEAKPIIKRTTSNSTKVKAGLVLPIPNICIFT